MFFAQFVVGGGLLFSRDFSSAIEFWFFFFGFFFLWFFFEWSSREALRDQTVARKKKRKKQEEGKRKNFEARMIRKAKREGKDLEFYLRQGAAVPTLETIKELKKLGREEQMKLWKDREHSQHCLAFHLGDCPRGRGCAFLHVASKTTTTFEESDEVAGWTIP